MNKSRLLGAAFGCLIPLIGTPIHAAVIDFEGIAPGGTSTDGPLTRMETISDFGVFFTHGHCVDSDNPSEVGNATDYLFHDHVENTESSLPNQLSTR